MAEEFNKLPSLRELDLSAEHKAAIGEVLTASVAVQVYRQLQDDALRRGDSGCNIIGNCSSSSKLVQ